MWLKDGDTDPYILAWTDNALGPLLSNTGSVRGSEYLPYQKIRTFNPYTGEPVTVILAKDLVSNYFKPEGAEAEMSYKPGDKVFALARFGSV